MNFIKINYQGLLLCLIIGIIATLLGNNFSIIGGPVFAILLGLIVALLPHKDSFQSGITFTSKKNPSICNCFTWIWYEPF